MQLAFDYYEDLNEIHEGLDLIQKSHIESLTKSMWVLNHSQVEAEVSGILSVPGIESVQIWDDQGMPILTKGAAPTGKAVFTDYPLVFDDPDGQFTVGHMRISASLEPVFNRLYKKIFVIFFTQFLKTVLVSSLIFLAIHHLLTRHLGKITRFLRDLDVRKSKTRLQLDRPASPPEHQDELDVLVQTISSMQENLAVSYQELESFSLDLERKVEEKTALVLEQMQKLEHSSKMSALGQMAGGVAHEINNPLTVIRLKAEVLQKSLSHEPADVERLKSHVSKITETTDRIAKIIEGLRFFARDGRNDSMETATLRSILENTLSLCREHFHNHNVDIHIDPYPVHLELSCRPVEISQVLLNLMSNAFDAIADLDEKWIRIQVDTTWNEIHIRVIDSGKGVPADLQSKIMQPFFTTKEVGKGTGLGLSISAGIARNHGGQIRIDTTSVHTCFSLQLPRRPETAIGRMPEISI